MSSVRVGIRKKRLFNDILYNGAVARVFKAAAPHFYFSVFNVFALSGSLFCTSSLYHLETYGFRIDKRTVIRKIDRSRYRSSYLCD